MSELKETKKMKDRAVLPKPKLIFYIIRSQKNVEPDPHPKHSLKGAFKYYISALEGGGGSDRKC